MSQFITDLEPKILWENFNNLNAIPRASTKEEEAIAFVKNFGKQLQLETVVDKTGNVIIRKPGTLGKENDKTVVLQGHLDMVHQKLSGSSFDFDTQGIEMYIDGDWVKARETTLGADNGIGSGAIMAVLASTNLVHPPLEALFTIDEEMGMTGAMALTTEQLKGEILLNLDSEEDDEITIGCAGGVDVAITSSYETELLDNSFQFFELKIAGLTGGHSGVDIHLNRANAIKILPELLLNIEVEIRIATIESGSLTNVIPRDSRVVLAVKNTEAEKLEKLVKENFSLLQSHYSNTDPKLNIELVKTEEVYSVMAKAFQSDVLKSIKEIPNGVFSMTEGMSDLVQTSNNISVISVKHGAFKVLCHTRSSVDQERDSLVKLIENCFLFAKVSQIGPYPGWKPQPDSLLLKKAIACYTQINNVKPAIKSIHAGLECGILSETFPQMEMISFGPNILGAHSPDERLQISSTQKFWLFLTRLLEEI